MAITNFEEFFQKNKDKINKLAEMNTKRNDAGDAVISRDDPWFYEDEWDELARQLEQKEKSLD